MPDVEGSVYPGVYWGSGLLLDGGGEWRRGLPFAKGEENAFLILFFFLRILSLQVSGFGIFFLSTNL